MTLLLWLSNALFKPILALFEEREKRIGGAKHEAQGMISAAQEKAQQFEIAYEKAKSEARLVLTSLKHDADKEQSSIIARVREQAKEKLDKAEAELREEERQVRSQLGTISETLSSEIIKALMTQKA